MSEPISFNVQPIAADTIEKLVALFVDYANPEKGWTGAVRYGTVRGRGPESVYMLNLEKDGQPPVALPLGDYLLPFGEQLLTMTQAEVDAMAAG